MVQSEWNFSKAFPVQSNICLTQPPENRNWHNICTCTCVNFESYLYIRFCSVTFCVFWYQVYSGVDLWSLLYVVYFVLLCLWPCRWSALEEFSNWHQGGTLSTLSNLLSTVPTLQYQCNPLRSWSVWLLPGLGCSWTFSGLIAVAGFICGPWLCDQFCYINGSFCIHLDTDLVCAFPHSTYMMLWSYH